MLGVFKKIFGTKNARELKKIRPVVERINALEADWKAKSDADLRGLTAVFKERVSRGESLDSIAPEAFATVREAGRRILGMRHFDVQLVGGMVLHEGTIAEMRTGEGKTLVATLPAYLNALAGKGVHVVTVNDYLARRDSEWMGRLHDFLGMSCGVIVHGITDEERKRAYRCDITYGTNNEFGFDYLRDNMKQSPDSLVQRELHYAIVDEVDTILIDEARTPLIISGPAEESTDRTTTASTRIIPSLEEGRGLRGRGEGALRHADRDRRRATWRRSSALDEPLRSAATSSGCTTCTQALRAHSLYKRDVDYVVKDGEVIIVDEFTGRAMPGRRWSDGLHQAVEAKEGVPIKDENQTLATITFQNYFRMYKKLAGMTGTAETEAEEFPRSTSWTSSIIPTNQPMIRNDTHDLVYKNERGQVQGRASRRSSSATRRASRSWSAPSPSRRARCSPTMLRARGHPARGPQRQAARARGDDRRPGRAARARSPSPPTWPAAAPTSCSAATPRGMARKARSWQIPRRSPRKIQARALAQVRAPSARPSARRCWWPGGLHIVGTERHEARRIDNQLRGRAGRQGDPGSSRFYLSLRRRPDAHASAAERDHRADGAPRHGGGHAHRAPRG